jgi:paraquat-inducible protein B
VDLDRIHDPAGRANQIQGMNPADAARFLTEKGLRAELQSSSLVTGQLYIDLDFRPAQPPRQLDMPTRYPQIPTTPTKLQLLGNRIEKLATALSDLPLAEIARDLSETLLAIRDLARSPEIRQALTSAGGAGKDLSRTLSSVDRLVTELRSKVGDADVKQIITDLHDTLDAAEKGLVQVRNTLAGTSGAQRELSQTLSEISRAAAAVRLLAEYLERNPSALVDGKPAPAR